MSVYTHEQVLARPSTGDPEEDKFARRVRLAHRDRLAAREATITVAPDPEGSLADRRVLAEFENDAACGWLPARTRARKLTPPGTPTHEERLAAFAAARQALMVACDRYFRHTCGQCAAARRVPGEVVDITGGLCAYARAAYAAFDRAWDARDRAEKAL
jgi:hypothetical protein